MGNWKIENKGLSNSHIFQYLNFSFHWHFNSLYVVHMHAWRQRGRVVRALALTSGDPEIKSRSDY